MDVQLRGLATQQLAEKVPEDRENVLARSVSGGVWKTQPAMR